MEQNTDPVAPPPMCRLAFASPTSAWFDRRVRGDVTTAMFKAPSSVGARAQALHLMWNDAVKCPHVTAALRLVRSKP
jgi:hypothetical protein